VMSFHNILEFKSSLEKDLEVLKRRSEEYSSRIGEKLRVNDVSNESDLADLREKIAGPIDPKKKKPVKKKDQKGSWHDLGGVFIYDGIGLRGELEIHFKALEEVKSRIEKLQKIKESMDNLVSRGVKKDLACATFLNRDLMLDMAFTKSAAPSAKFTYKSIFNVEAEHLNEIKI
ncbi:MAG: hypothetical protein KGH88_10215, partial [Thaumarchaeota archaeon]|nr:hypothetical protein [Nitrososphaerota archaeon]